MGGLCSRVCCRESPGGGDKVGRQVVCGRDEQSHPSELVSFLFSGGDRPGAVESR